MPCDSVILNRTEFSAGTDPDLMKSALEDAGYTARIAGSVLQFNHKTNYRQYGSFSNGVFTAAEGVDTDAIKRAYSVRSVKKTAAKMGWTVKQDARNPLKLQITKRS